MFRQWNNRPWVRECRRRFPRFAVLLGSGWAVFLCVGGVAGEFHGGSTLVCSDCHTIHYSESGLPPPGTQAGGPWDRLLKYSNANLLCLSCHDGGDPAAPDVLDPVTQYNAGGDEHSGAGYFTGGDGFTNANGHDLGTGPVPVPQSTMGSIELSCVTCHDPHGNSYYRNLRPDPGAGSGQTVQLGVDVFENISPPNPPSAGGVVDAYKESNIGYRSGMVNWCIQCHDLALDAPMTFGSSHPNNAPLSGSMADGNHWVNGTGVGFGTTTGDGTEGIPRLRFQSPGATSYQTATAVSTSNEVFCLSCHLAHGGAYEYGLTWPANTPGAADQDSGCQQCHNM